MRKKNGRPELPEIEKRKYCVSVRMNPAELAAIDALRGRMRRGEAVRLALFANLPAPVPPINAELRADLGRALGNLATIAKTIRSGEHIDITEIKTVIDELRAQLIKAKTKTKARNKKWPSEKPVTE